MKNATDSVNAREENSTGVDSARITRSHSGVRTVVLICNNWSSAEGGGKKGGQAVCIVCTCVTFETNIDASRKLRVK